MTPLAVYIHWPFCKSKCPYCDFNSHVREGVEQARWRAALLRELRYMAAQAPEREVESIFFGGGTPSLMPAETVAAIIDEVRSLWKASPDIEITLEANPTSVEAGKFKAFKDAGVNRMSLGVQALNAQDLTFLGRQHNTDEALAAVALARDTFDRYSFDLIYARPGQKALAWEAELKEALRHVDGHMSLYQLTIEENTAFHHAYGKGEFVLPPEGEAAELYQLTEEIMSAHGLPGYEVSNYAKPGEESRHNLAYWLGHDYVGVGPGAHGRLSPAERRGPVSVDDHIPQQVRGRIATQTLKSPERWLEAVERQGNGIEVWQEVPRQQEIEERLMMGLRLSQGIDYAAFKTRTGIDLSSHLNQRRRDFYIHEGLLENDSAALRTTPRGRLLLNTLTAELLN